MTATALQRLLKYPHSAVFDKSPDAELALRLRHPSGASWTVADEVLTATAGGTHHTYDLTQYTLLSLASVLENDGFEIAFLSPTFANYGASVLVEGSGDQNTSNGDHLTAYKSPLWAIMGGYGREIRALDYAKTQALRQMIIGQAEGEWLDLWGSLYAEARLTGDTDQTYAERIPEEAFRIRVNGHAIEDTVKARTGKNIDIVEPWKYRFTLDGSALSGTDHFQDADYYTYFLIHPVAKEPVDWNEILPIIHRNRAAGIEVYAPSIVFGARHIVVQPPVEYVARLGTNSLISSSVVNGGEAPLGIMRLDDNEITLNHRLVMFSLQGMSNIDALAMGGDISSILDASFMLDQSYLANEEPKIISIRHIAYASICLSDGVALGDENAILYRGMTQYELVPPQILSDELALSDGEVIDRSVRVERITLDQQIDEIVFPVNEIQVSSQFGRDSKLEFYASREPDSGWAGSWDDRTWYDGVVMGMLITDIPVGSVLDDTLLTNISTIA